MLPVSRFISSRWNFNCFSNASVVGKSRWNQLQASSLFGQRLQRAHLVDFHRDVFESGRPSEIDSEWFRCLFLIISIWYWYVLIKYLMNKNHAASKQNLPSPPPGIWVPVSLWGLTAGRVLISFSRLGETGGKHLYRGMIRSKEKQT